MEQLLSSRDLRWRVENEQHWFQVLCGGVEHTLILHNKHGPQFPAHYADCEAMLVESKLLERADWGCHYLARWWADDLAFYTCEVFTEGQMSKIVLDTKEREAVVTLMALPAAAFFFIQKLRVKCPYISVRWMGVKK